MTHSLDNNIRHIVNKGLAEWSRTNAVLEQFDENFDKITDKIDDLEKVIKILVKVLADKEE